jgi:hypothetical protein
MFYFPSSPPFCPAYIERDKGGVLTNSLSPLPDLGGFPFTKFGRLVLRKKREKVVWTMDRLTAVTLGRLAQVTVKQLTNIAKKEKKNRI